MENMIQWSNKRLNMDAKYSFKIRSRKSFKIKDRRLKSRAKVVITNLTIGFVIVAVMIC